MSVASCATTTTGTEAQLEDKRDGNKYWVGKMLDGKCWMLQNLALDLTTSGLKSSDTNITSDWSSSSTYPPLDTKSVSTGNNTAGTAIQSWNFGKLVLATPVTGSKCGNSSSGRTTANCTAVGFVDVSSSSFSAGYTATTRSWDGANSNSSTLVAVNCTSWSGSATSKTCTAGTYDAHYLVGNYYTWNTATAGTGGTIISGEASGSICPKGWKLPTSNTTATGSFAGLLSKYGVDSNPTGSTYNIAGSPLRFVHGGVMNPEIGYVDNAGQYGYYWPSTPYSSNGTAYRLYFNTSNVYPSGNIARRSGLQVRCISQ